MNSVFVRTAIVFIIVGIKSTSALAQDAEALSVGIGAFNIEDSNPLAAELRLEYRPGITALDDIWGPAFGGIAPAIGLMANSDGAVFGYGALQADVFLHDDWVVTPALGVGGYHRGGSLDLGGVFQFHLGLTIAYGIAEGQHLGLTWAHISNAGIHESNPSVDSLLVTYRVRLGE